MAPDMDKTLFRLSVGDTSAHDTVACKGLNSCSSTDTQGAPVYAHP